MPTILSPIGSINNPSPMTVRERELVNKLRVLLKDIPDDVYRSLSTLVEEQRGERWTDMQLLIYLQQAIADINAEPAHTYFTLNDAPVAWEACILQGGMVFSLIAEGILQVGKQIFNYIRRFFIS